jgi:hypothetical protein
MAATEESIEISRRPEDVFTYVLEPLHYHEWDDSVVSARRDDPSPLTLGSKTTVLHRMGPWKVPTTEEVVEFNPPRQFTNRGVSGPLAGVARCTVEPLSGGQRSRLTIALEIEARGLGKLLLPLARRNGRKVLPRHLKKLKEILDGSDHRSGSTAAVLAARSAALRPMQNSFPSGSANTTQPVPSGRRMSASTTAPRPIARSICSSRLVEVGHRSK